MQAFCEQDDLISGFLSKAKGQLLRIATCLHVLFKISTPNDIDETIDELALKAAIDFIEVCCDHAFMITGRRNILHRVENDEDGGGKYVYVYKQGMHSHTTGHSPAVDPCRK